MKRRNVRLDDDLVPNRGLCRIERFVGENVANIRLCHEGASALQDSRAVGSGPEPVRSR